MLTYIPYPAGDSDDARLKKFSIKFRAWLRERGLGVFKATVRKQTLLASGCSAKQILGLFLFSLGHGALRWKQGSAPGASDRKHISIYTYMYMSVHKSMSVLGLGMSGSTCFCSLIEDLHLNYRLPLARSPPKPSN